MITIFKDKRDIPQDIEYIEWNDIFFNQNTASRLDDRANRIVEEIDASRLLGKFRMQSRFDDVVLDVDRLSAGCKTLLNVLYYPDRAFCLKECGNNALEILYGFDRGYVFSDYALIPFNMKNAIVRTKNESRIIDDYEELKEWWSNEE